MGKCLRGYAEKSLCSLTFSFSIATGIHYQGKLVALRNKGGGTPSPAQLDNRRENFYKNTHPWTRIERRADPRQVVIDVYLIVGDLKDARS